MNYLTNYYKNLCEQRQEQIRLLEQQLAEGERWDKFKSNFSRGELKNLGNLAGALAFLPYGVAKYAVDRATRGGASQALAGVQRAVAGGLGAASRGLERMASSAGTVSKKVESGAKQSEARAAEMDVPARAADQHLADVQAAFQRRLPEIAQSVSTDVASMRHQHVHRAYSDRNWEQAKRGYQEPQFKVKKNATEEEKRAAWWAAKNKADEAYQKSEKAADEVAGKEFDKLHAGNMLLGRLASHISRLSSKGEGNKPPKLPEGAPAIARYSGGWTPSKPASEMGTEVLSGGWGTPRSSDEHEPIYPAETAKYSKWWESEGQKRGAPHPNELFPHGVQHVDERFEHLLGDIPQEMLPAGMTPKKLRALNAKNRTAAVAALQRANEIMTTQSPRRDVPIKMMESKKAFLNNQIKYLLENKDEDEYESYDVDFGDDEEPFDADLDNDETPDRSAIEEVENLAGKAMDNIGPALIHPNAKLHKDTLNRLNKTIDRASEIIRLSDITPDDVARQHQNMLDVHDEIDRIRGEWGITDDEDLEESRKLNKSKFLSEQITKLFESN
jgi:hypothetical protein